MARDRGAESRRAGVTGRRGRGRGAQSGVGRRNEGRPAGQLPGGESTVRPREPGLKALAAAQTARPAHRVPRPPGQVPPRPSGRPRLSLHGFLIALLDHLSVPDPEDRGHGPEQPVGGRIPLDTHPFPAASAPTNLGLWNPVELSRPSSAGR